MTIKRWRSNRPEAAKRSARRSRVLASTFHPLGAFPNPAWHRVDAGEGGLRAGVYWPPSEVSRGPASSFNQATPPFGVLRSGAVPRQHLPGASPGPPQRLICHLLLRRDVSPLGKGRAVQTSVGSLFLCFCLRSGRSVATASPPIFRPRNSPSFETTVHDQLLPARDSPGTLNRSSSSTSSPETQ